MLSTTFAKLKDHNACVDRYEYLAKALGGIEKYGRDKPITLLQILDTNGFEDALWALRACDGSEKFARLLACDFAEHVLPIFEKDRPDDKRPREAIETARRHANGEATDEQLAAAWDAAWAAAWDAARDATAWDAARAAVWAAARGAAPRAAAWDPAWNAVAAAWDAARDAVSAAAAWDAAWDPGWRAEVKWQEQRMREMLTEAGNGQ